MYRARINIEDTSAVIFYNHKKFVIYDAQTLKIIGSESSARPGDTFSPLNEIFNTVEEYIACPMLGDKLSKSSIQLNMQMYPEIKKLL